MSQQVAKKAFLFSYYAGGLRVSDMLSMRVSHFAKNGMKFWVMKTRKSITVQYSFELMLALSLSFKTLFEKAIKIPRPEGSCYYSINPQGVEFGHL